MSNITYLDFDLLIQQAGDKNYHARALNSPVGQADIQFRFPFNELETENFLLRLGPVRGGVRRVDSPETEAAKRFGGGLFAAVFSDDLQACLTRSIDEAARQKARLRIRLRLKDVPELADLPWEYLYNGAINSFLALSADTALVRYMEVPQRVTPLNVSAPLRVLVLIASPANYDPLDVKREWSLLHNALGDLEAKGQVVLEPPLERASLDMLRKRLQQQEYHIFHFIGHGGFDQRTQEGVLAFEDDSGGCRFVSGQQLGVLLRNHPSMRLAVLNSCEGARGSNADPFAGLAQSLTQAGMPAVIAMQFKITDDAAITFASEFYGSVARGLPVDAALTEARVAIFTSGNGIEWGTPVLYLRAADGCIFNIESPPPTSWTPDPPPERRPVGPQPVDPPSPPRNLGPIKSPEGALDPDFPCYIQRRFDRPVIDEIAKGGVTITILGPRQVGKSSLLCRVGAAAEKAGKQVVALDFQRFDTDPQSGLDQFLQQFAATITDELGIDVPFDEAWADEKGLGPSQRCTRYIEKHILKRPDTKVSLFMDEVDLLLDTGFHTPFFRMLRSWHNSRALRLLWRKLDLVLVSSTEPHFFIENEHESPFNVGQTVTLEDFTPGQVVSLNELYNRPLSAVRQTQLIELVGGHPYLSHKAIHLIYSNTISVEELFLDGKDDRSPFNRHLRHLYSRLRNRSDMKKGLGQVLRNNSCPDEEVFHRLRGAGLVRREGDAVVPRCKLYGDYFRGKINE